MATLSLAKQGQEENLGRRDRRVDWIETGASDAETGNTRTRKIQEQTSSRTKRSRLKQEEQRNKD